MWRDFVEWVASNQDHLALESCRKLSLLANFENPESFETLASRKTVRLLEAFVDSGPLNTGITEDEIQDQEIKFEISMKKMGEVKMIRTKKVTSSLDFPSSNHPRRQ